MPADAHIYLGHRERLQEKFMKGGAAALADYEFLELILTKAIPRRDVKPLAKQLLEHFKTFSGVLHADPDELKKFKGVKDSTCALFRIIIQANQKLAQAQLTQAPVLSNWIQLVDYCFLSLADEKVERFIVLFLDAKLRVICDEVQQTGTIDRVPLYPREVLKRALNLNAAALVLVHNHPSGDPKPSAGDLQTTRALKQALVAAGIQLHDHLIIGKNKQLFSFKAQGVL